MGNGGFVGLDEGGDVVVVGSEVIEEFGSLGGELVKIPGIGKEEVDIVALSMMPACS